MEQTPDVTGMTNYVWYMCIGYWLLCTGYRIPGTGYRVPEEDSPQEHRSPP